MNIFISHNKYTEIQVEREHHWQKKKATWVMSCWNGAKLWLPTKSKGEAKFAWPFNLTSGAVRRRQTTVWMHKTRRKEWDIYRINWWVCRISEPSIISFDATCFFIQNHVPAKEKIETLATDLSRPQMGHCHLYRLFSLGIFCQHSYDIYIM